MITAKHTYRGVCYQRTDHEKASSASIEHIYRGKRYQSALKHEAVPADTSVELHYRGKVYHHRLIDASSNLNQ